MTAIVLLALATLGVSFLCSMLEAALYSVTPAQLEVMKTQGVRGSSRFARFRADVEIPIASILTINTISNTLGAAWLGNLVGSEYDSVILGWFTVAFTLAVLIGSEIIPKSLGVRFGKHLVPILVWPLQLLVWIAWPVARACRALMIKLIGEQQDHTPTDDEILEMSKLAERGGELTSHEHVLIRNALSLDRVSARDLVTPRTVVQSLTDQMKIGDLPQMSKKMVHSRLPLTEDGDLDKIIGVVYRRELYEALAADRDDALLRDFVHPLEFVPELMKGPQLIEKFIRGKRHIVAVVDEYGGFEGIVTLEDVLECLLGVEIVDEHDEHVDMQALARKRAQERHDLDEIEDSPQS